MKGKRDHCTAERREQRVVWLMNHQELWSEFTDNYFDLWRDARQKYIHNNIIDIMKAEGLFSVHTHNADVRLVRMVNEARRRLKL